MNKKTALKLRKMEERAVELAGLVIAWESVREHAKLQSLMVEGELLDLHAEMEDIENERGVK